MAYEKSALTDDMGTCYLCGRVAQQMHHIFNGPERAKSTADNMIIPVCAGCHDRIHKDAKLRRELKAIGQRAYERSHSREEFRERYGKSYL